MKQLRHMWYAFTDWLLYTSLFAAFCAVGLCSATEQLLIATPQYGSPLYWLVFGGTLIIYNIHYVTKEYSVIYSDRFAWSSRNKIWHYIFLVTGLLLCLRSIFLLPPSILIACFVMALLALGYSLPFLPRQQKKRLKEYGLLKIFLLAGVWTIVTGVIPILYYRKSLLDYPFELCLRFVFMFILCVAFDVRDMQTDKDAGIHTLPNRIGIARSYRLMDIGLILFILLSGIQYLRYPIPLRLAGAILTALVTKWTISYTRKYPSDKAYLLYIDGMMLFYALVA